MHTRNTGSYWRVMLETICFWRAKCCLISHRKVISFIRYETTVHKVELAKSIDIHTIHTHMYIIFYALGCVEWTLQKKELEREFQFCFSNSSLVVSPRFFIGTNKTDLYSDMTIRLPTTRITQSTIAHTHNLSTSWAGSMC